MLNKNFNNYLIYIIILLSGYKYSGYIPKSYYIIILAWVIQYTRLFFRNNTTILDSNYSMEFLFLTSFLFAVIGQLNGIVTHGGYKFFGLPNPYNHQDHHLYFNKNFGAGGPWDYLLGTN